MGDHAYKAIAGYVKDCPCDDCIDQKRCGYELLACESFVGWLDSGKVNGKPCQPTRQLYQKAYYSSSPAAWEESRDVGEIMLKQNQRDLEREQRAKEKLDADMAGYQEIIQRMREKGKALGIRPSRRVAETDCVDNGEGRCQVKQSTYCVRPSAS